MARCRLQRLVTRANAAEAALVPRAPRQALEEARFGPRAFEQARPSRSGTSPSFAAPSSRLGRLTIKLSRHKRQYDLKMQQRHRDLQEAKPSSLWSAEAGVMCTAPHLETLSFKPKLLDSNICSCYQLVRFFDIHHWRESVGLRSFSL